MSNAHIFCLRRKEPSRWKLGTLYLLLLPLVLVAAPIEGLWPSRTRPEGYDWKAWATSLGDLTVRRLLVFIPCSLATPVFAWAYDHRLFTTDRGTVGGVLLLFISLEFFHDCSIAPATPCAGSATPIRCITRPTVTPCRRPIGGAGSASSAAP